MLDPCYNVPCLHGGTCSVTMISYTCACAGGWYGFECQCKYRLDNVNFRKVSLNTTFLRNYLSRVIGRFVFAAYTKLQEFSPPTLHILSNC